MLWDVFEKWKGFDFLEQFSVGFMATNGPAFSMYPSIIDRVTKSPCFLNLNADPCVPTKCQILLQTTFVRCTLKNPKSVGKYSSFGLFLYRSDVTLVGSLTLSFTHMATTVIKRSSSVFEFIFLSVRNCDIVPASICLTMTRFRMSDSHIISWSSSLAIFATALAKLRILFSAKTSIRTKKLVPFESVC